MVSMFRNHDAIASIAIPEPQVSVRASITCKPLTTIRIQDVLIPRTRLRASFIENSNKFTPRRLPKSRNMRRSNKKFRHMLHIHHRPRNMRLFPPFPIFSPTSPNAIMHQETRWFQRTLNLENRHHIRIVTFPPGHQRPGVITMGDWSDQTNSDSLDGTACDVPMEMVCDGRCEFGGCVGRNEC